MKKNILFTVMLLCAFLGNAQDNWITFKDYPTDININLAEDTDIKDTPFVIKNKEDQIHNYILPVKFTPIPEEGLTDLNIKIKNINASYDIKGRLMIYFRGKIDMSCCYQASISLEFYDDDYNLIQTTKTDEFGNFKLKSINGNLIEINHGKLKFNFTQLKSFDANADIRFATIEVYEKPIDEQFKTSTETTVVNTVVNPLVNPAK